VIIAESHVEDLLEDAELVIAAKRAGGLTEREATVSPATAMTTSAHHT